MDLKIKHSFNTSIKYKLANKIRLANLIELSEHNFSAFITETENNPIFKKLFSPPQKNLKIISYKNQPNTRWVLSCYELNEKLIIDKRNVDIETIINKKKDASLIIKNMGLAAFEKYFLHNEGGFSIQEISSHCKICEEDVKNVNDLINDISINSEFYFPSKVVTKSNVQYHKVAKIEKDGQGNYLILFYSPKLAQGKYIINYSRLRELKQQNVFTKSETMEINKLLNNLEQINTRKSILYQIIKNIIEIQKDYFIYADERYLAPCSQKKLALQIGVDESLISRAIYNKSIEILNGIEKSLKFFFPSIKYICKNLIKNIISSEKKSFKDIELVNILEKKHNINISRRTIAVCRKELGIDPYNKRITN